MIIQKKICVVSRYFNLTGSKGLKHLFNISSTHAGKYFVLFSHYKSYTREQTVLPPILGESANSGNANVDGTAACCILFFWGRFSSKIR